MTGHFEKTADENVWRLVGVDEKTGENSWTGLMMVDVDDLLVSAEEDTAKAALGAIASVWATSEVEKVEEGNKPLKYCGFELEMGPGGDGFLFSQRMYEKEMLQRWEINNTVEAPHYRLGEGDEDTLERIDPKEIKVAQGMAGALLWLTTRTRPDLATSVAAVCRFATKNPEKCDEVCQGDGWSALHQESAD